MRKNNYINRVLSYIECDGKTRKRLKEDLSLSIDNRLDMAADADLVEMLGSPEAMANEMIDNHSLRRAQGFEYISEKTLFGLPLVHISTRPRGIAKGVFAIGIKSIGIFSIGVLSLGIFSTGVLTVGLLTAFGSLALSGLFSFGAIAVSLYLAFGAIAVGKIALGALAFGSVAVGDVAYGSLAIFRSSGSGDVLFESSKNHDLIRAAVKEHVTAQWLIDIIMNMVKIL